MSKTTMHPLALLPLLVACSRAEIVQIVTPETPHAETNTTTPAAEDSYLAALRDSQSGVRRREEIVYGKPHLPETYNTLGLSSDVSDSEYPILTYNQPPSVYGPPSPVPMRPYGPPTPPASYGTPFAAPQGLLPSLPKLDVTTIFKIVLKMVLFKMIVKFIAVICLLLFIPAVSPKNDDGESERQDQLNFLTDIVWGSLENNGVHEENEGNLEEEVEDVVNRIDKEPSSGSAEDAMGFLEMCVSAANSMVGWMMSALQKKRNEPDPLWEFVWDSLKNLLHKL